MIVSKAENETVELVPVEMALLVLEDGVVVVSG
jgi:hypothetical protein